MMKRPHRSAMWWPSMSQSAVVERPSSGVQKPSDGDRYSITSGHHPQANSQGAIGERAGDPEHGGHGQPCGDALEVAIVARVRAPNGPQRKEAPADLHDDVGARERQAFAVERLGDRRGEHQRRQHQHEQHQAYGSALGVQPIGDPGGVDPHPPHRHHQQQRLEGAGSRQMVQERVRELGDGEDENQVEEQLDERDLAALRPAPLAQQTAITTRHASSFPLCPTPGPRSAAASAAHR